VDQGRLIIEVSRSHSDKPHSVGLLWTSDQPVAETSTWQHTKLKRERSHILEGFEPTIPANECPKILLLARKSYKYCIESSGKGEEMEVIVCRRDYEILKRICMKLDGKLILETLTDRGEIYQNARRKAVFFWMTSCCVTGTTKSERKPSVTTTFK
jgi:hypothetical protein